MGLREDLEIAHERALAAERQYTCFLATSKTPNVDNTAEFIRLHLQRQKANSQWNDLVSRLPDAPTSRYRKIG